MEKNSFVMWTQKVVFFQEILYKEGFQESVERKVRSSDGNI